MADIKNIVEKQKGYFRKEETIDVKYRLNALKTLKKGICEHEEEIMDALKQDLNKPPFEAYATEIGVILEELTHMIKNLSWYARKKKVPAPITQFKSTCYMVSEPYGVCLVMSPWNYPFQLTIAPLIGSIAGGNCTIIKPSAYSPNTSAVIAKMIGKCFSPEYAAVIEGGREANEALLDEKFDYIFFTGSVSVGKTIMKAASEHLTPVTLELGGKSPCIVDSTADLELAARRIVWGKFLNAGQTCVAPDHVLVHKEVKDALVEKMKKYILEFYGEDATKNEEFPRIINEKHFNRVKAYLDCGRILTGGSTDKRTLRIAPAILDQVGWEDPVMQEEIFGPILPVLEYSDLNGLISDLKNRPKPLALYLFTTDREAEAKIVNGVSFGGGCINDTIVHLATSEMPFGGVGNSGMGGYHGKWSFETFTHTKSILKKSNLLDIKLRYPPYGKKLGLLKQIMK